MLNIAMRMEAGEREREKENNPVKMEKKALHKLFSSQKFTYFFNTVDELLDMHRSVETRYCSW